MPDKHNADRARNRSRFHFFRPLLAGATLHERLLSCAGALASIALTGLLCGLLTGKGLHLPLIVAPIGASAVLLFAVPSSPLAQPWPIIGGNVISALVGIATGSLFADAVIASGVGVALAIGIMSLTRSLHPPGGAAALTAILGGPAVSAWGYWFPLVPVALNSLMLVACGMIFHRFCGRAYPHAAQAPVNPHGTADRPVSRRLSLSDSDIDDALTALNDSFDIDREDLSRLLEQLERTAAIRFHAGILCADIMSRDVVRISPDADCERARSLLLRHGIRTLPVQDRNGQLAGTVSLRELTPGRAAVGDCMVPAVTASPLRPALELLPELGDGRNHAAVIIDTDHRIVGLVSQTDLLNLAQKLLARQGGVQAD